MTFKTSITLLSIGFSTLTATPALADITADDLWNSYQTIAETVGGELTATTTRDGNKVRFSEAKLNFSLDFPEGSASVALFYPTLSYTDNADGTVAMDMDGDHLYKVVITGLNPDTDTMSAEFVLNYSDAELIASGSPDEITFTYAMDAYRFGLQNLTANNIPELEDFAFSFTGEGSGLNGSSRITLGDLVTITDRAKVSSLNYNAQMKDQSGIETVTSATYTDMASDVSVALPTGGMSITNLAAALKQGLSLDSSGTYGASSTQTSAQLDGEEVMSQSMTGGASTGRVSANKDAIQMTGKVADVSIDVAAGAGFPFDLSAKLAQLGMDIKMPVTASEAPQDYTVALSLGDLTVNEELWSLFDPAAVLPREPATIDVDLTGQTTVFQDFMNFAKMMELSDNDVPLELNALTIKNFLISAAGASLSATGDFAFNNDDLTSFDGIPAPSGSAEVQISGANGLIDKLIEMGLIAESDAMGARMMMGMLAVPGEGEDSLKSNLEITEDGQILANGQRIK